MTWAGTTRRSCETPPVSSRLTSSWSNRPTGIASTLPTTEGVDELVAAVDEVARAKGRAAGSGLRHRPDPGVRVDPRLISSGRGGCRRCRSSSTHRWPPGLPMSTCAIPEAYDEQTGALLRSGDSPLEYPDEEYTVTPDQSKAIRHQRSPLHDRRLLGDARPADESSTTSRTFSVMPAPRCSSSAIRPREPWAVTCRRVARPLGSTGRNIRSAAGFATHQGFSAHADEDELISWLTAMTAKSKPRRVFVVHGDPDPAANLARRIKADLGVDAHVPRLQGVDRSRRV